MRHGFGPPPEIDGAFVCRGSDYNSFTLCSQRWYNANVARRVKPQEDAGFLAIGTATHEAIHGLHTTKQVWEPDMAVARASEAVARIQEELAARGRYMTEKQIESRKWFVDWFPKAFPLYALKWREAPWDEVLCVEQPCWVNVTLADLVNISPAAVVPLRESGHKSVTVTMTPDALAKVRGRIWHVQRKVFAPRTVVNQFLDRGRFMAHEILYLWFVEQEWGVEQRGHTLFDIIVKLDVPDDPETLQPPAGCKKCNAVPLLVAQRGQVVSVRQGLDNVMEAIQAAHSKSDQEWHMEHLREATDMLARYEERIEKKRHEFSTYLDRAFIRSESIIPPNQRARMLSTILYGMASMAQLKGGVRIPIPAEGWACNAYFEQCQYVGVCAGRETLNGPQFVDKEAEDGPAEE